MAEAAKSEDPSIDRILASIRLIVAEDDSEKSAQLSPEAAEVQLNPAGAKSTDAGPAKGMSYSPPPLELPVAKTGAPPESAKATGTFVDRPTASSASTPPALDSSLLPVPPVPTGTAVANRSVQSSGEGDERGRLMSSATSAAVDSAFNALAQTVLVDNAQTLEDLVRQMLRPMLKVWLDDNLPAVVERLVRAEIERVSRGRVG
jgi:uncharacterized protein